MFLKPKINEQDRKEIEDKIDEACRELHTIYEKVPPTFQAAMKAVAAVQLRICLYNNMEAGIKQIKFNTVFRDQDNFNFSDKSKDNNGSTTTKPDGI